MYDHRQHQACGDDGVDNRIFLCSGAENSQHYSRVITEQCSFIVWRLAIAFARRRSSVVSSECHDLYFDSAGNNCATINSYPTRRDYCKLLALLRTETSETIPSYMLCRRSSVPRRRGFVPCRRSSMPCRRSFMSAGVPCRRRLSTFWFSEEEA